MGAISSFLIALETEDITSNVDDEMQKAVGKKSVTSDGSKRNLMETEDVLGTKSKTNKKDAVPEKEDKEDDVENPDDADVSSENDDPSENDTDDLSDNEDGDIDDPDSDSEDGSSDDIGSDDVNPEENPGDSDELNNKIRLRENMILFYNILTSNIHLLGEYSPHTSTSEASDVISRVGQNLSDCKEALFTIITEELDSLSYVELLRKYIALNRVYDLNTQMLKKHFDNLELIETSGKKGKNIAKPMDKKDKKDKK